MNDQLTFAQFKQKHQAKFATDKVSAAAQRKRYDDYVASRHAAKRRGANRKPEPRLARSVAFPKHETDSNRRRAVSQRAVQEPLTAAMMGPFDIKECPRIPDGEFTTTATFLTKYNVPVKTNDRGDFCVVFRPTPWAALAVSNEASNCATNAAADSAYVSPVEQDAFAVEAARYGAGLGSTPRWAEGDSWCIPTPDVNLPPLSGGEQTLGDIPEASALYDVASAWRPVCGGVKMSYVGPVLEASGSIAVARLPGTYQMPTASNYTLNMNGNEQEVSAAAGALRGLNYQSLQELPGAEVYPAKDGFTAVWAPNGTAAQKTWRPVKPMAMITNQGFGYAGIEQYSDTLATGEYLLPPPVTGDPARFLSRVDSMMTMNANNRPIGTLGIIGGGTLTYFQGIGVDGPSQNTETARIMQNLLRSQQLTSMMSGDNAIVAIGTGLQPNTTVGTLEVAAGFEYIADTRVSVFGGGASDMHRAPVAKQAAAHAAALCVAKAAPTSLKGADNNAHSFIDAALGVVEDVAGAIPKVVGAVEEVMPFVASLLAAL